ncbi:hypothetical protein TRFO_03378 [Tritrichomonas foetus]|uniref:Protein kinase domain-containing protein n=1 Tax=Tritrichomonas foetus TaxID=1144522 RepID=A0A1J4KVR2_9EUKA|nr:hypothetical protein TRFO_03378 [Tritrichomonas foetus]|eukprot:OHT13605.1 hypothetical protein TRFO_03378 [Tritrichomonas foetus]
MDSRTLRNTFVNTELFTGDEDSKVITANNNYKIVEVIEEETDEIAACKILNTENLIENAYTQLTVLREVLNLKSLHHPGILQFKGFNLYNHDLLFLSQEEIDSCGYDDFTSPTIFSENLPNGKLSQIFSKIKKVGNKYVAPPEWTTTKRQIAIIGLSSAVAYLHKNSIIHRGITPDAVQLDQDYYPRITDFSKSRDYNPDNTDLTMTVVTAKSFYQAPEIILHLPSYGQEIDIFSLGMLIFYIFTNQEPFSERKSEVNAPVFPFRMAQDCIRPEFPSNMPSKVQALLRHCWSDNPSERPYAAEIYEKFAFDPNYLIDDTVDSKEVEAYIQKLDDFNQKDQEKQNDFLSLSQPLVLIDDPLDETENTQTKSTDVAQFKLPIDLIDQKFMLKNILTKGFTAYDENQQIALFKSLWMKKALLPIHLVKISQFVNNLSSKGNQLADSFLKEVYGEYIVPNGTRSITANQFAGRKIQVANIPPSVQTIDKNAFSRCDTLVYVNIPNSVVRIEDGAFDSCTALLAVNIPASVTYIGQSFTRCDKIHYIEVPKGIQEISKLAFACCTSLKSVLLNSGLKIIGERAFHMCDNLDYVEIPETVELIRFKAFAHCSKLKTINMKAKNVTIQKKAIQVWKTRVIW